MKFHSYRFECNQNVSEILVALLSENNFSGFSEEENSLVAFISEDEKISEELISQIESLKIKFPSAEIIPDKNWNEEWESKISPIEIDDEVLVRTTFHKTEKKFPIEIIIQPKMSFGTGHHATTFMMIQLMLNYRNDFVGAKIFDFGAGTGILSIAAEKLGAKNILAIDNEEWAYENMIENFEMNKCANCIPQYFNQPPSSGNEFDIILANINRNVILEFLSPLQKLLKQEGKMFCSGFLPSDKEMIIEHAGNNSLSPVTSLEKDNWCAIVFEKKL